MDEDVEVPKADETEPIVEPYVPFPSFDVWSSAPFDASLLLRFESQLEEARRESDPAAFNSVIEQATRSAAVDTGALEGIFETDRGFTYSVAVGAALTDIRRVKGEKAARAIQDAINAYEFVLSAATRADRMTEVWIRELHAVICKSQTTYTVVTAHGQQEQDLPKGVYKTQQNNPLHLASNVIHSYAPVPDTPPEMARLIEELRSPEFESAHPVVQAAYAHYAFVSIHPFADGNGRVSRALASAFLYRAPGIPLVIYADQKAAYLDSLEAADAGDYARFQDFVKFRVIDTLSTARQDLRAASGPTIAAQLEALAILQSGRAGLPHTELDSLAIYMLESLRTEFAAKLTPEMNQSPLTTRVSLNKSQLGSSLPDGIRAVIQGPQYLDVQIDSAPPGQAQSRRLFVSAVARPGVEGPDLFITDLDGRIVLEAFVHDLSPTLSESLVHRASRVAEAELSRMLSEVVSGATDSLRSYGYGE